MFSRPPSPRPPLPTPLLPLSALLPCLDGSRLAFAHERVYSASRCSFGAFNRPGAGADTNDGSNRWSRGLHPSRLPARLGGGNEGFRAPRPRPLVATLALTHRRCARTLYRVSITSGEMHRKTIAMLLAREMGGEATPVSLSEGILSSSPNPRPGARAARRVASPPRGALGSSRSAWVPLMCDQIASNRCRANVGRARRTAARRDSVRGCRGGFSGGAARESSFRRRFARGAARGETTGAHQGDFGPAQRAEPHRARTLATSQQQRRPQRSVHRVLYGCRSPETARPCTVAKDRRIEGRRRAWGRRRHGPPHPPDIGQCAINW